MTAQSARILLVLCLIITTSAQLAHAQASVALDEVLARWRGDPRFQFVELQMLADGQQFFSISSGLVFDGVEARVVNRRFLLFTRDLINGRSGTRVLIATDFFEEVTGIEPDFVMPLGYINPDGGRVCYQGTSVGGTTSIDCVAWGAFEGARLGFGPPTPLTPINRALRRTRHTGRNQLDWLTDLQPTPENNFGDGTTMITSCRNGFREIWEDCEPGNLAGESCESLDFATGELGCFQCLFDVRDCSACGNDTINGDEECDGSDLGDLTCWDLGFIGGDLVCSDDCELQTAECAPTFDVPGGGGKRSDCLVEWRLTNAGARPDATGKAKRKQRCHDGDPGCDQDSTIGTCTFEVGVCLGREDARLPNCGLRAVKLWKLKRPKVDDDRAGLLIDAVAALGGIRTENVVTFVPPLAAVNTCSELQPITLATGEKLKLKARGVGQGGRPKDSDVLKLVCRP